MGPREVGQTCPVQRLSTVEDNVAAGVDDRLADRNRLADGRPGGGRDRVAVRGVLLRRCTQVPGSLLTWPFRASISEKQ